MDSFVRQAWRVRIQNRGENRGIECRVPPLQFHQHFPLAINAAVCFVPPSWTASNSFHPPPPLESHAAVRKLSSLGTEVGPDEHRSNNGRSVEVYIQTHTGERRLSGAPTCRPKASYCSSLCSHLWRRQSLRNMVPFGVTITCLPGSHTSSRLPGRTQYVSLFEIPV